ncbi:MAG: ferredoxin [Alphaproteobacteria bacterium]|jgi:hypothetical protein
MRNPPRISVNVAGDFYATGDDDYCDCLACGVPQEHAPSLLSLLEDDEYQTYFIRQPDSEKEIEQACAAVASCCISALRYGGQSRPVIRRLGNSPEYCDYVTADSGQLLSTLDERGRLLPRLAAAVEGQSRARSNLFAANLDGNAVLWHLPYLPRGHPLLGLDAKEIWWGFMVPRFLWDLLRFYMESVWFQNRTTAQHDDEV